MVSVTTTFHYVGMQLTRNCFCACIQPSGSGRDDEDRVPDTPPPPKRRAWSHKRECCTHCSLCMRVFTVVEGDAYEKHVKLFNFCPPCMMKLEAAFYHNRRDPHSIFAQRAASGYQRVEGAVRDQVWRVRCRKCERPGEGDAAATEAMISRGWLCEACDAASP